MGLNGKQHNIIPNTMTINVMYIDRVEFEDNAYLPYDLYGHALAQEPLLRGHDILIDPSLQSSLLYT